MISPATEWSPGQPLPMSCSRAATRSRSGRWTRRVNSEARTAVSMRCRSTVQMCTALRWGRQRTRSQSGRRRVIRPSASSASQTSMVGRPEPSRVTSCSRASAGQGLDSGRVVAARRRTACRESGRPAWAAAAAARRGSTGSRSGRAARASTTSPSCSTTPSASGERSAVGFAPPPSMARSLGRTARERSTRPTSRQVTSLAYEMTRADSYTCRSRVSASRSPSSAATWSCSWSASRSVARPVARCRASRTSSSRRRASSRPSRGASASQEAATARRIVASLSPPRASLRSGSRRYCSSPWRSARSAESSWSSGSRLGAWLRQSARTAVRSPAVSPRSPAMWRASRRPSWTFRSSPAVLRASAGVRTEWSRSRPRSQTGYQIRSARAATASASEPSCSRSRSRSLRGDSSPRP